MTARDIAYREALGLGSTDPLPKQLGTVTRSAPKLRSPRVTATLR